MPAELRAPINCLITPGRTTRETTPSSEEFRELLALVARAVAARVPIVQLREKSLSARFMFELASKAASLARGSRTRVLVNDRADIARAASCDGVQLTTRSLEPGVVRRAFGADFLVGVSTHSLAEARAAREGGADFALFGPVFDTPSKRAYGPPLGLEALGDAARALAPFPLVALGGISPGNARSAFEAGAAGVAAVRMFAEAEDLAETVRSLNEDE